MFAEGGKVLANGRMVHDLYLFEVKKPSESKKPWDYYKQLAVVPGDQAFFTAKESGCPLTSDAASFRGDAQQENKNVGFEVRCGWWHSSLRHHAARLGHKETAEQAFGMLAVGGTATIVGMIRYGQKIELRGFDFLRERRIQGSWMGSNHFRVDMAGCEREGEPVDVICRHPGTHQARLLPVTIHEALREYLRPHPVIAPRREGYNKARRSRSRGPMRKKR